MIDLDQSPISRGRNRDELGQAVTRSQPGYRGRIGVRVGARVRARARARARVRVRVRVRARVRVRVRG